MATNLDGQSAIVTGAGSGICFAFARLLLENGVNVLLADLTLRAEAQDVVAKYQKKPRAIFVKTDVSSWKDLSHMFKAAEEAFGTIEIVCPGAGIFEPSASNFWIPPGSGESKDDPFGDHYKTLEVNITHPIRVTQLAISHFMATKPGPGTNNIRTILHVVSVGCEYGFVAYPMYIASKFALHGFIESLASLDEELGIRVVGIAPGAVKTPLWFDAAEKRAMLIAEGEGSSEWTTPEVIAKRMLSMVANHEMTSVDDDSKIEIKGGLVLEAGATHVRPIPVINNSGPRVDLPGMAGIVDRFKAQDDAFNRVKAPGWGQYQRP